MKNTFEITTWSIDLMVVLRTATEMDQFHLPSDTYIGGNATPMDDFLLDLGQPKIKVNQFLGEEWVIMNLRLEAHNKSWTKTQLDLVYDTLHKSFRIKLWEWEEVAKHFKD